MSSYETSVEDWSSKIVYSDGWETISGNHSSNETDVHYTAREGSYAEFAFEGIGVAARFNIANDDGLAVFQLDDGPLVFRDYNSAVGGAKPGLWDSGSLEPGCHKLVVTSARGDSGLSLDYIKFQPSPPSRLEKLISEPIVMFCVIGGLLAFVLFLFFFATWRARRSKRRRELEDASFSESVLPANDSKRSTFRLSLFQSRTNAPRKAVLPSFYSRPPGGPTENIFPTAARNPAPGGTQSGIKYSFTRAELPISLEAQLPVRQPPPIHFGWKI